MFDGFRDTSPLNENFADLGYESSNFLLLIGALFILILVFIAYFIVRKLLQILINGLGKNSTNCCMRRLKKNPEFRKIVFTFYLETSVEFTICAIICTSLMSLDNFKNFKESF